MKITKTDIKILVDLYKSIDGLTPYIFFQRYKFSPVDVYKSSSKLENKKLVSNTEDDKLIITEKGKEFIEKNKFIYGNQKYDRIPNEFKGNKIAVDATYIPNLEKISKEILTLQNIIKGDS